MVLYFISHLAVPGAFTLAINGNIAGTVPIQYGTSQFILSAGYTTIPFYIPDNFLFTDTGAANAYVINVVALDFSINFLSPGKSYRFKAANTNGGASTMMINPGGVVKNITTKAAGALGASAIVAGGIYTITYDGTQFQLQ